MHWALFGLQQTACAPGLLVPGMKMPEHCSPAAREHPCQWLRPFRWLRKLHEHQMDVTTASKARIKVYVARQQLCHRCGQPAATASSSVIMTQSGLIVIEQVWHPLQAERAKLAPSEVPHGQEQAAAQEAPL